MQFLMLKNSKSYYLHRIALRTSDYYEKKANIVQVLDFPKPR